ncbi:MAG: hypothetical protein AAGI53_10015 [Planctomycetota bacterium]
MRCLSLAFVALVLGLLSPDASAQGTLYQGRLDWNGQPANGAFDFIFNLQTQPVGGGSIGNGVTLDDWPVDDGVVTALLNFGGASLFTADRWISIQVREGSSDGAYTELLPRQLVSRTPRAFVADRLSFPSWMSVTPGLSYGSGLDGAYINRDTPINSSERFGVHSDGTGFQGMYVSTSSPDGAPYYGYSVEGAISAYHYYNNVWRDFRLFVNTGEVLIVRDTSTFIANRVTVDADITSTANILANGAVSATDVSATNAVTSEVFAYTEKQRRRIAISGAAFRPADESPYTAGVGNGDATLNISGSGRLIAPVYLPDGAEIIDVTFYHVDETPTSSISMRLAAVDHLGGLLSIAERDSVTSTPGIKISNAAAVPPFVVDYGSHALQLTIFSADWESGPATGSPLGIQSVVIQYDVASPD